MLGIVLLLCSPPASAWPIFGGRLQVVPALLIASFIAGGLLFAPGPVAAVSVASDGGPIHPSNGVAAHEAGGLVGWVHAAPAVPVAAAAREEQMEQADGMVAPSRGRRKSLMRAERRREDARSPFPFLETWLADLWQPGEAPASGFPSKETPKLHSQGHLQEQHQQRQMQGQPQGEKELPKKQQAAQMELTRNGSRTRDQLLHASASKIAETSQGPVFGHASSLATDVSAENIGVRAATGTAAAPVAGPVVPAAPGTAATATPVAAAPILPAAGAPATAPATTPGIARAPVAASASSPPQQQGGAAGIVNAPSAQVIAADTGTPANSTGTTHATSSSSSEESFFFSHPGVAVLIVAAVFALAVSIFFCAARFCNFPARRATQREGRPSQVPAYSLAGADAGKLTLPVSSYRDRRALARSISPMSSAQTSRTLSASSVEGSDANKQTSAASSRGSLSPYRSTARSAPRPSMSSRAILTPGK